MKRKIQRQRRSWAVLVAAACWLFAVQMLPAFDASNLLSKGPYLQAPGSNTMTILWESMTNYPATLSFGLRNRRDNELGPIFPQTMVGLTPCKYTNVVTVITNGLSVTRTNIKRGQLTNLFYLYEARLTGLKPGATYSYSVRAV